MSNSTAHIAGDASTSELDALVRKHSAFSSIYDLLSQGKHGYRPTLDVADPERKQIADIYDAAQAAVGSSLRAYRYESESTIKQNKKIARRLCPNRRVVQVREG